MSAPDNSTSVSTNNGGRQMLRIPLATAGSISAVLSLIGLAVGFGSAHFTFKAQMERVTEHLADLQVRVEVINAGAVNDRQALTNRLTGLETETKWIKEGVSSLQLMLIPKK